MSKRFDATPKGLVELRPDDWPAVDEDISIRGMLDGVPARRPRAR